MSAFVSGSYLVVVVVVVIVVVVIVVVVVFDAVVWLQQYRWH